jgi:hypothetical protein
VATKTMSLEQIQEDLLARSFLYDNPDAYRDGVEATVDALRQTTLRDEPLERRSFVDRRMAGPHVSTR